MSSFSAQVKQFSTEAKENAGEIFSLAIFYLERGIKQNIRKDTFNMGRSILVSTTAMPQVDTELKEYEEIEFIVPPTQLGKPVWIGIQAVYAPRWEFGFTGTDSLDRTYNQAGDFTIQKQGALWQSYVTQAEVEVN